MKFLLAMGVLLGIFSGIHCNGIQDDMEIMNVFLRDLISTFKLLSPSIIFQEEAPDVCMKMNWMLCLPNSQGGNISQLADHLITIHNSSKAEGIIFLENEQNRELFELLSRIAPSIFRTNSPVFMPREYVQMIKLRLDSNVIFYERKSRNKYNLFDIFTVKGGPLITLDIGKYDVENGIRMQESISRWERRKDLKGSEFINALAFNGVAARFIFEEIGKFKYN